ncbi:hypothetical protein NC651_015832 [Populus alba x Populus x berolinensis]|nr:hypothetical protein NC651_015832 [Populus alba x Populus x berolinensis]
MGQIKILKRGKEDLIEPGKKDETPRGSHNTQAVKSENLGFVSTDMLGPNAVLVSTQIRLTESMHIVNGFYARSAFITSRHPVLFLCQAFSRRRQITLSLLMQAVR